MVNTKLLKSKMVLFNDTNENLATAFNVNRQTVSAKINGKSDFRQSEIKILIERYELTPEETDQIFFN